MDSGRAYYATAAVLGGLTLVAASAAPPGSTSPLPTWRVVLIAVGAAAALFGTVGLLSAFPVFRNMVGNVNAARRMRQRTRAARRWRADHSQPFNALALQEPQVNLYLYPPAHVAQANAWPVPMSERRTFGAECTVRSRGAVWHVARDKIARASVGVGFPKDFTWIVQGEPPEPGGRYTVAWAITCDGRTYSCRDSFRTDEWGYPVHGPVEQRWVRFRARVRRLASDDRDAVRR